MWVRVGECHVWKAVMPSWAIGHQTVPSSASPMLCNTVFFKDKMVDLMAAEMLAHGDTGLACANDEGINMVNRQCSVSHLRTVLAQSPARC
jgi:hypothetical protein